MAGNDSNNKGFGQRPGTIREARGRLVRAAPAASARPRRSLSAPGWYALAALLAVAAFGLSGTLASTPAPSQLVALFAPQRSPEPGMRLTPTALPRADLIVERQFSICGSGRRVTCVVDGDTIWLKGAKIRIADINTPEVSSPACAHEAQLGARATRRLQELLNAGPFEVRSQGRDEDRYGRKLRTLHRDGRSLGDTLVAEGLAHHWRGGKESWCG